RRHVLAAAGGERRLVVVGGIDVAVIVFGFDGDVERLPGDGRGGQRSEVELGRRPGVDGQRVRAAAAGERGQRVRGQDGERGGAGDGRPAAQHTGAAQRHARGKRPRGQREGGVTRAAGRGDRRAVALPRPVRGQRVGADRQVDYEAVRVPGGDAEAVLERHRDVAVRARPGRRAADGDSIARQHGAQ